MEGYEGKWEGLALGSLVCAFTLCAAFALLRERMVNAGGLCLVVPVAAACIGASDWAWEWLPEFSISFRDYPPRQWANWPVALLLASTAVAAPEFRKFKETEWVQFHFLLPILLVIALVSEAMPERFFFPSAVAIEAWCTIGVLIQARTSLKDESFGRIPMFLVMAIVPGVVGVWVAHKVAQVESGEPLVIVSLTAGATALAAAIMAVLLREEIEASVTRLLSPNLKAAEERSRQLESELLAAREAQRITEREALIGEVVLSVAHQIKNPLGPMKGYAQMIEAEVQHIEPPERRERMEKGLRIILEESERIDRQVHELLTFAGGRELRQESVDVNRLLERAVAFVSPETRDVSVVLNLAESLPEVTADSDHMHEAFLNLILNAVEAMSDTDRESVLALTTKLADGQVFIQVADTGTGIDEEDLTQIFEPFFSRKRGGFGLGLSITRSVIQEMEGEIECASEEGEGTVFTVKFPQSGE